MGSRKSVTEMTDQADLVKKSMRTAIAKAYLLGAREQVVRYQDARTSLATPPVAAVYACLHEASNLFEDLGTLAIYFDGKNGMGIAHQDHALWKDARDHIRHDVREEFDLVEGRKSARAKRLAIHDSLQLDLAFQEDGIKIGETKIDIEKIVTYLDWAEAEIASIQAEATEAGLIETTPMSAKPQE